MPDFTRLLIAKKDFIDRGNQLYTGDDSGSDITGFLDDIFDELVEPYLIPSTEKQK